MIRYIKNNIWLLCTLLGVICLILEIFSGNFPIMCLSIVAFALLYRMIINS